MTQKQRELSDIRLNLKEVDQWMRENRPVYYEALNPGLSLEKIREIEKNWGRKIPDELVKLFSWRNGQSNRTEECFLDSTYGIFYDLEGSIAFYNESYEVYFVDSYSSWWMPFLFAFAEKNGDYICYALETNEHVNFGEIIYLSHETGEDAHTMSPNLNYVLDTFLYSVKANLHNFDYADEDWEDFYQHMGRDYEDTYELANQHPRYLKFQYEND